MPAEYVAINYPNRIAYEAMETFDAYANTGAFGGEFANFLIPGGFLAITLNLIIMCGLFHLLAHRSQNRVFVNQWACLCSILLLNATTIKLLFSPTGILVQLLIVGLAFLAFPRRNAEHAPITTRQS